VVDASVPKTRRALHWRLDLEPADKGCVMRLLLIHARAMAEAAMAFREALPPNEAFDIAVANERGMPPFDHWAAVVLMWSKEFGAALPAEIDRAVLDAWAENKLLLFRLDDSELPLGLRDLPAIRAVGPLQKGLLFDAGKALKESIRTGLADGF